MTQVYTPPRRPTNWLDILYEFTPIFATLAIGIMGFVAAALILIGFFG